MNCTLKGMSTHRLAKKLDYRSESPFLTFSYEVDSTYALSQLTWAAKVNDFDGRSFGIAEQYVLGLQITVYYVQFGCAQEQQRRAELLRKFAR